MYEIKTSGAMRYAYCPLRGLAEGGQLDDPAGFVKRINQLMLEMSA